MIIRFRVGNFRSILDEQELTFVAYNQRENTAALIQTGSPVGGLLRVAAIYGANASGKSNVLSAFWFLRLAVRDSQRRWEADGVPVSQFAGQQGREKPSSFAVDFIIAGERFEYGFESSLKEIKREWLYSFPSNRKQKWFEREGPSDFSFGKSLQGPENRKKRAATIPAVRSNSLFLSAAIQNNFEILKPIYDALVGGTIFVNDRRQSVAITTAERSLKDSEMRSEIAEMLKAADLGLVGYEVEEEAMTDSQQQMVHAFMATVPEADRPKEMDFKFPKLEFIHQSDGEESFRFEMTDESDGTVAYFGLLGPITKALKNGSLLVVDELETSLHPLLSQVLVRLFNDPSTNPLGAQLLFSTHAPTLLAPETLRRDQIWITQKSRGGVTEIFPVSDFHARKGERLDRGYMQGRFGGVPFLDIGNLRDSVINMTGKDKTSSQERG